MLNDDDDKFNPQQMIDILVKMLSTKDDPKSKYKLNMLKLYQHLNDFMRKDLSNENMTDEQYQRLADLFNRTNLTIEFILTGK